MYMCICVYIYIYMYIYIFICIYIYIPSKFSPAPHPTNAPRMIQGTPEGIRITAGAVAGVAPPSGLGPQFVNTQFVHITCISLWFMVYITIVNGGYKPTCG